MKHFLCIIAVLCFTGTGWAQSSFSRAEELYRQDKFAAALGAYEEILKNHPKDPFVYYNIGNCYFKMGSTGLAAVNYYRAFKLAPRDPDIRHNLTLALASGGEKFVPSGIPVIVHRVFFGLSLPELKGFVYVLFWGVCALALLGIYKRRWSRWLTGLLVIFLLAGGWLYTRQQIDQETLAVIAVPTAEIRSGPGMNFPASASASQGYLVTVEDEKDNWYEIILSSQGIKGWIQKEAIEKI